MLLINNVLFAVAAATVLLGTLYPLFIDALGLGKISVGPPYFNLVFLPLMIPMGILTAVGPLVRWKEDRPARVLAGFKVATAILALVGIVLAFAFGPVSPAAVGGLLLAGWVAYGALWALWERVRHRRNRWQALRSTPRSIYGMTLAHVGLAVFIAGVTVVSAFEVEKDLRMAPGDTLEIRGYTYRFDGVRNLEGPNYDAAEGIVTVLRDGRPVTVLRPQKRTYRVQTSPMTEAGIDSGFFRDLYVSLGEPLSGDAWSVRVYFKPLVNWIWLGALLMALGGGLAAADRRYGRLNQREHTAQPDAARAEARP